MTPDSLVQESLKQHGHRALRLIDSYWHSLAAGGNLPRRADINPGAIQDALEFAFIADRVGAAHARMRVAGGAIGSCFGGNAAGLPVSGFLNQSARPAFDAALARCFAQRALLDVSLEDRSHSTSATCVATLRLYPLRTDRKEVGHLLGAFVACAATASTSRRFDIAALRETPWMPPIFSAPFCAKGHLRLVVDNT